MNGFGHSSSDPAGGASPASAGSPARPAFAGKTHAGLFVVTQVEQAPEKRSVGVPGLFAVRYRVSLEVRHVLPPIQQTHFVISGEKGEGPEAGALGLQDWLPTRVGDLCVLAFDPEHVADAREITYLGAGAGAEQTWRDCERFYGCLHSAGGLDAARVAAALAQAPPPYATFFELVFAYDRSVYDHPEVCRALGDYLANSHVPPMVRRTTVAHYLSQPTTADLPALRAVAGGMLRLAVNLADSGQTASAGVVFQRLHGFCYDTTAGRYRVDAPDLDATQRHAVLAALNSPAAGVAVPIRTELQGWLSPQ